MLLVRPVPPATDERRVDGRHGALPGCRGRLNERMARLFVAVVPAEHVMEELRGLRRKDQRGVRFVPPEHWHVTLRFLGEADPDEVIDRLAAARLPPAVASIGPAVDVFSDRALVVPVQGVDELAHAVAEATAGIGQPARRRFSGHLTLARIKPGATPPSTLGAAVRSSWDVDEVVLFRSVLHPDGARYTALDSFLTEEG